MATYTENYALVKPTYGELADVAVINGNMDTIDGIMHSNRTMLAPAFSQTEDYAVGDVVVYEGNLYRFIVPHTAGNWDGTEVEQTTLGEEVSTKGGADVTKTASGNPIEFSDGSNSPLVKCVTAIQGNQDLHGQTHPWVGGAGKNKADISANTVSSSQTWNCTPTYSNNGVIATATGTYARIGYVIPVVSGQTITISLYALKSANTYGRIVFNSTEDWNNPEYGYKDTLESRTKHTITVTTTSNILFIGLYCTTTQSSGTLTVDSVMVEYSNQATDFEPYSNICPITAYDESTISVGGKNLIDAATVWSASVSSDGSIDYPSGNTKYYIPQWLVGRELTFSAYAKAYASNSNCRVAVSVEGTVTNGNLTNNTTTHTLTKITFTPTSTSDYVVFANSGSNGNYIKIQLEIGAQATEYTPFIGTTHTATFSNSIYQGNADFIGSGSPKVRATQKKYTPTSWTRNSDHEFYSYFAQSEIQTGIRRPCISDKFRAWNGTESTSTYGICFINTDGALRINTEDAYSSALDMMTAIGDISFVCDLATPTEEDISPTNLPIKSLFGYNHIESSTGDMEIEYITEEFQPIVDLIESNSGKHEYSTNEQVVGTDTDGSTVYEITYVGDMYVPIQTWGGTGIYVSGNLISVDGYITRDGEPIPIGKFNTTVASSWILRDGEIKIQMSEYNTGETYKLKRMTVRYTKSTPTRSLNLTKSAVEEIPDEIKNAEYEEKPDVNEADDNAPTEVDER